MIIVSDTGSLKIKDTITNKDGTTKEKDNSKHLP